MTDERAQPIVCPGHGPMERLTYKGVVVRIRCRFCHKRPIDLLERSHTDGPLHSPCTGGADSCDESMRYVCTAHARPIPSKETT